MAFLAGCLQIWPPVVQSMCEIGWQTEDIHRCLNKDAASNALQLLGSSGLHVDALGQGCAEEPRATLSLDALPASESSRLARFLKLDAELQFARWIRQTQWRADRR